MCFDAPKTRSERGTRVTRTQLTELAQPYSNVQLSSHFSFSRQARAECPSANGISNSEIAKREQMELQVGKEETQDSGIRAKQKKFV